MADMRYSILLRNGSHKQLADTRYTVGGGADGHNWGYSDNDGSTSGTQRYGIALKCDSVAINYAKTPIQIPIPQESPELIDLGIFRPSITLSGIIDHTSGVTTDPFMSYINVTGKTSEYSEGVSAGDGGTLEEQAYLADHTARYYLPYKNVLENVMMSWITTNATKLELQIGDVDIPTGSNHTGGAIYEIAFQMIRFQQNAAQEDRWAFTIQMVSKAREDFSFA